MAEKTLKEYIKQLKKYAKEHPETLELPVVFGGDDNTGYYTNDVFTPSKGYYKKHEFQTVGPSGKKPNAVCVN